MTSRKLKPYEVRFASWTTFALTLDATSRADALRRAESLYEREGEHACVDTGGGTEPFVARLVPKARTKGGLS